MLLRLKTLLGSWTVKVGSGKMTEQGADAKDAIMSALESIAAETAFLEDQKRCVTMAEVHFLVLDREILRATTMNI